MMLTWNAAVSNSAAVLADSVLRSGFLDKSVEWKIIPERRVDPRRASLKKQEDAEDQSIFGRVLAREWALTLEINTYNSGISCQKFYWNFRRCGKMRIFQKVLSMHIFWIKLRCG
jgi:hypothetical protein